MNINNNCYIIRRIIRFSDELKNNLKMIRVRTMKNNINSLFSISN